MLVVVSCVLCFVQMGQFRLESLGGGWFAVSHAQFEQHVESHGFTAAREAEIICVSRSGVSVTAVIERSRVQHRRRSHP